MYHTYMEGMGVRYRDVLRNVLGFTDLPSYQAHQALETLNPPRVFVPFNFEGWDFPVMMDPWRFFL